MIIGSISFILFTGLDSDEARTKNKAVYRTTLVVCGCAGAVVEKVTGAFGQEQ